jgi:protein-S-isoprenylcysteine O-methyltransferase Ste14
MVDSDNKQVKMDVIKQLIVIYIMIAIQIVIFFISAGQISIRPLLYFVASFIHYLISTAVLFKLNPELISIRLKRKREGSKSWDEILMRVTNLWILIIVTSIAGLDVGRYKWLELDIWLILPGFLLLTISTILLNWAMVVNRHFESTVRIQKDRGHKVITTGPYKIVRHPGYLAGILSIISIPLIIGSGFTFIPVGIYIILVSIRTLLEDRTLQIELDGYSDYTKKVKYRLFPGIW